MLVTTKFSYKHKTFFVSFGITNVILVNMEY